jgi:predicted Zn-dependent protease
MGGFIVGIENMKRGLEKAMVGMAGVAHNAFNVPTADIAGQINNAHAQSQRQMSYDFTNELTVDRQPIIVNVYDNKEAVRAYVNENNAIDATIRRF